MFKRPSPIYLWNAAGGVAAYLLAFALFAGAFFLAALARARDQGTPAVIALGLLAASPFAARYGRRLRTRYVRNIPDFVALLQRKKIPLILYLREFNLDASRATWDFDTGDALTWEESFVASNRAYGAVLAVETPSTLRLPFGGAYRIRMNDSWQSDVLALMDLAQVIVLRCSTTPGASWELEQILNTDRLARTVFETYSNREASTALYRRLTQRGYVGSSIEHELASKPSRLADIDVSNLEPRIQELVRQAKRTSEEIETQLASTDVMLKFWFVQFWVVTAGRIEPCESFDLATGHLQIKKVRSGIFDSEDPLRIENLTTAAGLIAIPAFMVTFALSYLVPGIDEFMVYVLFAALGLLFIGMIFNRGLR